MASNLKVSLNCASAQAAALVGAYTNGSILNIYQGTQPATPETAIGAQVLLASIVLPSPAFTQVNGVMTANAIASVTIGVTGTAQFFRWNKSDNTTPIADGSIGVSGADMNLNSVALSAGATLAISSMTYTVPGV